MSLVIDMSYVGKSSLEQVWCDNDKESSRIWGYMSKLVHATNLAQFKTNAMLPTYQPCPKMCTDVLNARLNAALRDKVIP